MTDRQKYNNKSSIDINSLSKEEIIIAIREWAEGDTVLEEFLFRCYNEGVETKGSNSGGLVYVDFSADHEVEKLKNIVESVCDIDGFQILIMPDGGNPFSGDVFYKPSFSLAFLKTYDKNHSDEIFKKMSNSFDKNESNDNKMINSMIDLYSFFSYKESELDFRLKLNEGIYSFSIELNGNSRFEYYNNLFNNIGMKLIKTGNGVWCIESDSIDTFSTKLSKIKDYIIGAYNLELPNKLEDGMSYNERFRVLRREYIKKYGNDMLYKEFINNFNKRMREEEKRLTTNKESGSKYWQWIVDETLKEEKKLITPLEVKKGGYYE